MRIYSNGYVLAKSETVVEVRSAESPRYSTLALIEPRIVNYMGSSISPLEEDPFGEFLVKGRKLLGKPLMGLELSSV